jgi:hypothetical protein
LHGCYLGRTPFGETAIAPLLVKRETVWEIAQKLEVSLHSSGGNHDEYFGTVMIQSSPVGCFRLWPPGLRRNEQVKASPYHTVQ